MEAQHKSQGGSPVVIRKNCNTHPHSPIINLLSFIHQVTIQDSLHTPDIYTAQYQKLPERYFNVFQKLTPVGCAIYTKIEIR